MDKTRLEFLENRLNNERIKKTAIYSQVSEGVEPLFNELFNLSSKNSYEFYPFLTIFIYKNIELFYL